MMEYTDAEKARIKSIPMNRINAMHVPEIVKNARAELKRAEGLPHHTKELAAKKEVAVMKATEILNERLSKLKLYREVFPGIYL